MEKQNHIWVVEMLEGSAWMPTMRAERNRKDAERHARHVRQIYGDGARVRATKYTAPRGYA